jgi:hypothetical protein
VAEGSAASIAVNVFTSPSEAFRAIKDKPRVWLPLILLLAGVAAVTFIYMNGVDIQWYFERQLGANPRMTEAQAEQAAATVASLPQVGIAASASLAGTAGLVILLLLQALYLKLVGLFTKDGIRYGQWFGLIVWTSLPSLLGYLATLVNLLTNDITLLPQERINPLTFASLIGLGSIGDGTLDQIVMNMGPLTLWSLLLMMLGYRKFTSRSTAAAAAVVLAPTAIIAALAVAL